MARRVPLNSNCKLYEDYFTNQVGHGLPVFTGSRNYNGYGLGSILAGIGRAVVPLLRSSGKAILSETAKTGMRVAQDVLSGQNIRSSIKQRAGQAGKNLLNRAIAGVKRSRGEGGGGSPSKRIKTGRKKKNTQRRRARASDIFG